jgi:parallel beta-helix repeat protein
MISNNTIMSNDDAGVRLEYAGTVNNQIHNNILRNNTHGILLRQSSDFNTITANGILDNMVGIEISETANNTIYHNNFLSNTQDISEIDSQTTWDNGLEGNYWNSYYGKDGIGDSPLQINASNTDHYPLMGIFRDFKLKTETENLYGVQVISNSTILNVAAFYWNDTPNQYFQNGQAYIRIDLAIGPNSTGFGRATFPKALLNATQYVVLVNMTEAPTKTLTDPDSTLAIVYFQYSDSARDAIIVPEFSLLGVIFTLLVGSAGLLAYSVQRRREDPSLSTKT